MPNVLSPRDLVSRPDNMDETVLHTNWPLRLAGNLIVVALLDPHPCCSHIHCRQLLIGHFKILRWFRK